MQSFDEVDCLLVVKMASMECLHVLLHLLQHPPPQPSSIHPLIQLHHQKTPARRLYQIGGGVERGWIDEGEAGDGGRGDSEGQGGHTCKTVPHHHVDSPDVGSGEEVEDETCSLAQQLVLKQIPPLLFTISVSRTRQEGQDDATVFVVQRCDEVVLEDFEGIGVIQVRLIAQQENIVKLLLEGV